MRKVKTLRAKNDSEAAGIRKAFRAMGVKAEFTGVGRKRNPRRMVRRNVEGFLDAGGRFHPIRGSEGYSDKEIGWKTAGRGGVRARKKSKKAKRR